MQSGKNMFSSSDAKALAVVTQIFSNYSLFKVQGTPKKYGNFQKILKMYVFTTYTILCENVKRWEDGEWSKISKPI